MSWTQHIPKMRIARHDFWNACVMKLAYEASQDSWVQVTLRINNRPFLHTRYLSLLLLALAILNSLIYRCSWTRPDSWRIATPHGSSAFCGGIVHRTTTKLRFTLHAFMYQPIPEMVQFNARQKMLQLHWMSLSLYVVSAVTQFRSLHVVQCDCGSNRI
ncbi:hypothetical protein GGR53DRAFT_506378 [Hypoxylon sp. FL1150]|nr:hypothetical protein GGR53DRAFT_506378 [Hypoxylon sp. FL1150]